jgi:hypothetical protein
MDITYNHGDDNHFHGISWKYNVLTNKNMKKYNVDIMVIYLIFVNGFFFRQCSRIQVGRKNPIEEAVETSLGNNLKLKIQHHLHLVQHHLQHHYIILAQSTSMFYCMFASDH